MNLTAIFGIIAIILTFISYIPYIRDIFLKKTKPHIYTWIIWGALSTIISIIQKNNGGGSGSYVTLTVGIISIAIALLSLKYGTKDLKKIDTIFLILTILGIGVWLGIKNPIYSIILICGIDLAGFFPTIRKSISAPHDESLNFYAINFIRYICSIFALGMINFITLLFPLIWVIVNGGFVLFLLWRRSKIITS